MNTLEYLKGILNTFARLNTPNTELMYQYNIIEFETSTDVIEVLRKKCGLHKTTISYINTIDEQGLKRFLDEWLFKKGELVNIPLNDRRKSDEVFLFYNTLKSVSQLQSAHFIALSDDYGYIGIMYDFFLIKGSEKNYLLYFLYSD
ncbi:hypothetical protein [Chryseobacterium sp. Marseille-Q8038]